MSVTRNFRVTVNLSNFFHDHRNRARIFINDGIKRISDLEQRIEKIFNIRNFHLTSQNEFLPPSEDARILEKDDIIWVIQNGDHCKETLTPKAATKNVSKKSDSVGKKRSISLTDQYIEEELRSPKKKKKKKHELEQNQEDLLSKEPKKKKKKEKRADTVSSEEKCSNRETKYDSHKRKKKREKNVDDHSSENKVSTIPEDELNSPKNNVMKIDTLLPVLHSHINTYNKKMATNNLNKTASSLAVSEPSSPSIIKGNESDNEKKERYTYKGNLSRYKRNVPLPTITDKYLEQKKINIVKIEYLGGRPGTVNTYNSETETFNQSTEKQSTSVSEDQNKPDAKDIVKQNMTSPNDNDLAMEVISTPMINNKVKKIPNSDSSNDTNMETTTETETKNINHNQDLADNHDLNTVLNSENTSTCDIQKSISEYETKTDIHLITKVPSTTSEVTCSLSRNISGNSSSLSPCKEEMFKNNEAKSSSESSQMDRNQKSTPEIKKPNQPLSNITINTTRLVLKSPNVPYQQKYFAFKALASKKCESNNTSDSSKHTVNINKESSTSDFSFTKGDLTDLQNVSNLNECVPEKDTDDDKVKKLNPKDLPHQSGEPSKKIETLLNSNITVENISDEVIANISNSADLSIGTNDKSSKTTTELLDDPANKSLISITASGTNDLGNFMEDLNTSLRVVHRNSVTSEMDLTKVITNLDSTDVSRISAGGTSRFFKQKQLSGIGQLLEDLRGNDSVVSVESLDSDCSQFVTKRKRKRIRKRKKKNENVNNSDTSLNDSSLITEPYVPKPLNVKACPSIHIKFDSDEEGEGFTVTNVLKEKCRGTENDYVEHITIDSDLEESKIEKVKEDDILKSPSMKQMSPKIGDFIAFKILKITENYTPEISSYITGEVIQFNSETKQVTYEILSGLEQCETPKGKLSMEVDAEISHTSRNRREFAWVDLIDPRLVYP